MRFSTTARLILGIGIFAIVIGVVGWFYLQNAQEQRELDNRLSLAQTTLPTIISQKNDLESQLSQAESKLQAARSSFPDFVDSIRFDEKLFEIAYACDLKITSITSSEPTEDKTEGVTYSVAPFVVNVKGEVADILDFINTIATTDEYFTNATVELVNIVVPEPLTEKEKRQLTKESIDNAEKPSATINLVIYGYRGE